MFSRHHFFVAGLVLLFAVSFALPIVLGTRIAGVRDEPPSAPVDTTFPASQIIAGKSQGIAIQHSPDLDPAPGEDFLVFGWFKPRNFPHDGQRMVLFSKFNPAEHLGSGYAVGLEGGAGSVRPIVYWRDRAGKGRWLSFAELPQIPHGWFFIALSLHGAKFLGVHGAFLDPSGGKPNVILLGGYDVSTISIPQSDGAVVIGFGGSRRFTGRVGPFGVVSLPSFAGDFDKTLRHLVRNPLEPDDSIDRSAIKFWSADLIADQSGNGHSVGTVAPSSSGRAPAAAPTR